MIRHELLASTLRFYSGHSDDPFADFDRGVCTVIWESPGVLWIKAMSAELNRELLHELLKFLTDQRIHTVKAHRAPGRMLPLFKPVGDHFEMSVPDAALYAERRRAPRVKQHDAKELP